MKKTSLAVLVSLLAAAGGSVAQTQSPTTEIRESTDPSRVAEVERRAAELQANPQTTGSSAGSTGAASAGSSESSRASKREHRRHQGAKTKDSAVHGTGAGAAGPARSGSNPADTAGGGAK